MMYLHTIGDSKRYNGWANWHTFTIGSNLMNDEGLYLQACRYERGAVAPTWIGFIESTGYEGLYLSGVSVSDPNLDYIELDELIQEINA
jgi:hypothetical protein